MTYDHPLGGRRPDSPAQSGVSAEKIARNDALFENANFRDALSALADRALYLKSLTGLSNESLFAALALRDIVNGFVTNSSKGAYWLCEYTADRSAAKKLQPEKTNG